MLHCNRCFTLHEGCDETEIKRYFGLPSTKLLFLPTLRNIANVQLCSARRSDHPSTLIYHRSAVIFSNHPDTIW